MQNHVAYQEKQFERSSVKIFSLSGGLGIKNVKSGGQINQNCLFCQYYLRSSKKSELIGQYESKMI